MYKRIFFILLLGILLISLASAEINITAGELYSFVLSEQYSYYDITGNKTEVDLNITQNGTEVKIDFGKYMKSDTFIITFYNWKDEIIGSQQKGGGSSKKETIVEDETEECSNGLCPIEVVEDEEIIIIDDEEEEEFNWNYLIGSIILVILIFLTLRIKNYLQRKDA